MSGEILYVNRFERWVGAFTFGVAAVGGAVSAAGAVVADGVTGIALVLGLTALCCGALAIRAWRLGVAVQDADAVVRSLYRTRRIPLAGTRWGIVPVQMGLWDRTGLAVAGRDGRVRDLSRQGVWSPRRGAQHGRLAAVADLLDERAQAATPP